MIVDTAVLFARLMVVLASLVSWVVGGSVPSDRRRARVLAQRLWPQLVRLRQRAAREQFRVLDAHMRADYGLLVDPAPVRPYPRDAVVKAVESAAGLGPGGERPSGVEDFKRRLGTALGQHVQNAARELVIDSADLNSVQEVDPRQAEWDEEEARRNREDDPDGDAEVIPIRPDDRVESIVQEVDEDDDRDAKVVLEEAKEERRIRVRDHAGGGGPTVGWARVLVGEVNCPFCAMLASRGPVYRSSATAGFMAHSAGPTGGGDCDCEAVMVVRGQSWEGEAEWRLLAELWADARDNPSEYEEGMMDRGLLDEPMKRFRSRFSRLMREGGVEQFKSDAARLAEESAAEASRPHRAS